MPETTNPHEWQVIKADGSDIFDWQAAFQRLQSAYVLNRTALICIASETDAAGARSIALAALDILPTGEEKKELTPEPVLP